MVLPHCPLLPCCWASVSLSRPLRDGVVEIQVKGFQGICHPEREMRSPRHLFLDPPPKQTSIGKNPGYLPGDGRACGGWGWDG